MKKLIILSAILISIGMPAVVMGEVTTRVCEADGTTLFDNRDIMVGTKLTIIVHSTIGETWACDIAILGDFQNYGVLSGRDFNEVTGYYDGSRLPAAGQDAVVWEWIEEGIQGFNCGTDPFPTPGDWFIFDYTATAVGDCNATFYNFSLDPSWDIPFHHVPTRDFNLDTIVNFADFTTLAFYWQQGCSDPEWCEGADIDKSGSVNPTDLDLFCEYWLEKTE